MNWLLDNWLTILGASSVLGAPLAYIFGGRDAQKKQLKKDDVDIKSAEVDYASKISDLYEDMMNDIKTDRDSIQTEKENLVVAIKEEREYFRTQLDEVRKQCNSIQDTLNSVQLSWAREVEVSQNWEKLHRELSDKYANLEAKYTSLDKKYTTVETEYDSLKKAHDKLKTDFDKYKKDHKIDKV